MGEGDSRAHHQPLASIVDHAPDEALIDLDLARRDALEIFERREAGSIIVDRDIDPELAELRQHVESFSAAGDCGRFRQLQREAAWIEAMPLEQDRNAPDERLVAEQPPREVHRHVEIAAALAELCSGGECAIEDLSLIHISE